MRKVNQETIRSPLTRLRTALFFLGIFGAVASFLLALSGYYLANTYSASMNFSQISGFAVNPFRLLSVRYMILCVLFFLYLVSYKLKNWWRMSLSLFSASLMAFFSLLTVLDSGLLPEFESSPAFITSCLKIGGFVFLFFSLLIMTVNGATVRTTLKKNLP